MPLARHPCSSDTCARDTGGGCCRGVRGGRTRAFLWTRGQQRLHHGDRGLSIKVRSPRVLRALASCELVSWAHPLLVRFRGDSLALARGCSALPCAKARGVSHTTAWDGATLHVRDDFLEAFSSDS